MFSFEKSHCRNGNEFFRRISIPFVDTRTCVRKSACRKRTSLITTRRCGKRHSVHSVYRVLGTRVPVWRALTAVIDNTCYLDSSFSRPWLSRPVSIRRSSNYSSIAFTYRTAIPVSVDSATILSSVSPSAHRYCQKVYFIQNVASLVIVIRLLSIC